MTKKLAKETLDNGISENQRKGLVTYFLSVTMGIYKKDWRKAEKLYPWITEDDFLDYQKDKAEALKNLLGVPEFLEDVNQILSLENALYADETLKQKLTVGRPVIVEGGFDVTKLKTISQLLKALPGFAFYSREARQIKRKLVSMGHTLKMGRRLK